MLAHSGERAESVLPRPGNPLRSKPVGSVGSQPGIAGGRWSIRPQVQDTLQGQFGTSACLRTRASVPRAFSHDLGRSRADPHPIANDRGRIFFTIPRRARVVTSEKARAAARTRTRACVRACAECHDHAPAHTCEARLSSLHTPSARILPTNRPLLASSHFLCALVHSLSWRSALRLSLRHGVLRRWASRKIHRCLDPPRRASARVGVRCPLVLPPCAPAGCVVVRSAVARALPGPPFGPPFEPEVPSRRIWRVAGEMCAAVWASRMGCASVERACGASASLMCIISAFCTRASSG